MKSGSSIETAGDVGDYAAIPPARRLFVSHFVASIKLTPLSPLTTA